MSAVIRFGEREFDNVTDLTEFLDMLPRESRYAAERNAARQFMESQTRIIDQVAEFYQYVLQDGSWASQQTRQQFDEEWQEVAEVAVTSIIGRNRVAESRRTVVKHWGEINTQFIWPLNATAHTAGNIAKVARQLPFDEMLRRVNRVLLDRVNRAGRGKKKARTPQAADFLEAMDDNRVFRTVTPTEAHAHGWKYNLRGMLVAASSGGASRVEAVTGELPSSQLALPAPQLHRQIMPAPAQPMTMLSSVPTPPSAPVSMEIVAAGIRGPHSRSGSNATIGSTAMSISPMSTRQSPREVQASPRSQRSHRPRQSLSSPLTQMQGLMEVASEIRKSCSVPSSLRDEIMGEEDDALMEEEEEGSVFEDNDQAEIVARVRQRLDRSCACHGSVSTALKSALSTAKAEHSVRAMSILANVVASQDKGHPLCYRHLKNLASKLGMMTRIGHEEMLRRLLEVHKQRFNLGVLKTDTQTYAWFRMTHRPKRPSDSLGIYRFQEEPVPPIIPDPKLILTNAGQSMLLLEEFNRVGSVNIPDVFSWWWTEKCKRGGRELSIAEVGYEEFDMYLHHQREVSGKPNYGWLRTMFHSLIQQVMRQDPVYWMLYVALRPDKNYRLISYPYYAKYALPGDKTFFRHIDIRVSELIAHSRGANMIQGTVSLDDEEYGQCTQILPEMHKHIEEWWRRVNRRGINVDGFVHRIKDTMFNKDDAKHFNTNWTDVPCPRGAVRITLPHLPHGSHGPAECIRRTMLPWFVGIQEDHEALDTAESGSWSELSAAHRDLGRASATPSGLAVRYGTIPYKFPAAVPLVGLGGVSDALIGRQRWDTPNVMREVRLLLGPDPAKAQEYIFKWRERAVAAVVSAFDGVVRAEKAAYRQRSYFYCKARGIDPRDLADDDPPPEDLEATTTTDAEDPGDHY
jgi:hypothetical protein